MDAVEKSRLSKEAEMQLKALKTIGRWKNLALAVSTLGVAAAYAGFGGADLHVFFGILGVLLVLVGLAGAVILNLGLKNGRRNVEKILNILDKGLAS